MKVFHSGDFGDIIYFLPVLRELAAHTGTKPSMVLGDRPVTKKMTDRAQVITPLLEAIGIPTEVGNDIAYDLDVSAFRKYHSSNRVLAEAQWMWCRETYPDLPPWRPDPWIPTDCLNVETTGKIVVARSPRYQSERFPWRAIVERLWEDMVFVGLPAEYDAFIKAYGYIAHQPTDTLLDVAQHIAGARLFIGNQSSPLAIAIGMGKPVVAECSPIIPDCIYDGPFQFTCEDEVTIEGHCYQNDQPIEHLLRDIEVPPGGWTDPDTGENSTLDGLTAKRAKRLKMSWAQARRQILIHAWHRDRKFFDRTTSKQAMIDSLVERARKRGLPNSGTANTIYSGSVETNPTHTTP